MLVGAFASLPASASGRWQDLPSTDPKLVAVDKTALVPPGASYLDKVPDTLDLAEMAKRYIQGMTRSLLKDFDFAPPGHIYFFGQARMEPVGGVENWGKTAEALILARRMSGYDLDDREGTLTTQLRSFRNMIDPSVNLKFLRGTPVMGAWIVTPGPNITPMTVALEALIALYRQRPAPALEALIRNMVDYHTAHEGVAGEAGHLLTQASGSMMYYASIDKTGNFSPSYVGGLGHYLHPFVNGKAMRALSSWGSLSGDARVLDPIASLGEFLLHYDAGLFWKPAGNVPAGYGHFAGHAHGFLNGVMGLLWAAELRQQRDPNDSRAREWIRFAQATYLFVRDHQGEGVLGNFGEICTVSDMLRIAVKLTELGAGDYDEDIDRWLRNQIAEAQIRPDAPIPSEPHAADDLTNNIGRRVAGLFYEDAAHPFAIPNDPSSEGVNAFQLVACGLGNPMMGLYDSWEHIVRFIGSTAQVHLLMNRASEFLDIKSELPYRGRVEILTKENFTRFDTLRVRVPDWADKTQVKILRNDEDLAGQWSWADGSYLHIPQPQKRTSYVISFPMVVRSLVVTQTKSQTQMWTESNLDDPSHPFTLTKYRATFRGNTLVAVDRRPQGGVALYQRQNLAIRSPAGVSAPVVERQRFAPRLPTNGE